MALTFPDYMYMDVKFARQVADKKADECRFWPSTGALLTGTATILYLALMARNMTQFAVCFVRALVSLSLIACLTIAPICAARCATTLCVPGSTDTLAIDCHHSPHHSGSAPTCTTRSATPCGTAELVFTTSRMSTISVSLESYVFSIALRHLDVAMESLAFGLSASSARTAIPRFSPPLPLRL